MANVRNFGLHLTSVICWGSVVVEIMRVYGSQNYVIVNLYFF
jgi:hypothetical protein